MKIKTRNVTNNGKLPIGAYFGPFPKDKRWPDEPDCMNDKSFKLAREGGFNFMIGFAERYPSNTPDVNRSLECAAANGMRMILSDENIEQGSVERKYGTEDISGAEKDYQTSIDHHGDHKGYWGCYIVDEPCPPKFKNMRKLRDMFYRVSPNNLFFINMLPSYAMHLVKADGSDWIHDDQERLETFRKYIADYMDQVDPELFCYDYYPYMGKFPAFSGDFYANLAHIRRECQKRGKPFWVSPQAGVWGDPNTRGLSIGEMRHQNYISLAFGAKGFVYYVWTQAGGHTQGLCYRAEPTYMYHYAKECNLFIEKYEKDFIALKDAEGNAPVKDVLTAEDGKLVFSNTGTAAIETKVKYSNVDVAFDIVDVQRETTFNQDGSVDKVRSCSFGLAFGIDVAGGKMQTKSALVVEFVPQRGTTTDTAVVIKSGLDVLSTTLLAEEYDIFGSVDVRANNPVPLIDIVKDYIDHPGCAGVYGRDEPSGNDYAGYAKLAEAMYGDERFEGKDVYMNLLPTYASTSAFGKYKNYEGYVRGYAEECSYMPYIAYDHYPYKNAETCDLDKMNAVDYFNNLSIVRKVALEHGIPFWTYYCVGEVGQTEYPIFPDKEAYFWNINTNLVYGAKGLQLYSVIQSPVDEDLTDAAKDPVTGWNYERFGLVGAMGNVNRWWHYQVEFDKHLKSIDEYLMNAQNVGVIGVGKRAAYLGVGPEVITEGSFRELKSVSANEALVGCFDYNGTTMLYVLNNDIDVKQKVALNFDDKYGYDVYQRGELTSIAGKTLTLTLEAGEAALVKLRAE